MVNDLPPLAGPVDASGEPDLDLAPIKARVAAASKGPWVVAGYDREDGERWVVFDGGRGEDSSILQEQDAEFIADAREVIPALIAEIERLRAAASLPSPPAQEPKPMEEQPHCENCGAVGVELQELMCRSCWEQEAESARFHWRDGVYFQRVDQGAVLMTLPQSWHMIPANEWASIVTHLAGLAAPVSPQFGQAWVSRVTQSDGPELPVLGGTPSWAPQEWQPIETAPKDGSAIFAIVGGKVPFVCWWIDTPDCFDGFWRGDAWYRVYPHLWMPVPPLTLPPSSPVADSPTWLPIETAPEATWVLVVVPNYGMNIATMTRDPNVLGENGKFWFIRGEDDRSHPTHWMPLPSAPSPSAGAAQEIKTETKL